LAARRAQPAGDHDLHGGAEPAGARDAAADRERDQRRRAARAAAGWHAQGGDALGDRGDGGGHHHHAGHLRLRAPGRGPARQGAGAVPGDRAPAPFRGAHEGVRDRATRGAVRGRGSTLYDCRGAMVSPPASTWIIAGLVFLAVTLGAIALALLWEWTRELLARRAVRRQLERAVKGETAPGGTPDA